MIPGAMRYKTFTWPNNPETCSYTCEKAIVSHKYPELDASELEDLDPNGAIITGTGEFFGPDAYSNWAELMKVFRQHGPGDFYHPIFTDVSKGVMRRLQADMEPRENYVKYTFEIMEHRPPVVIAQKSATPSTQTTTTTTASTSKPKVGDTVTANGYIYASSDGSGRGIKLVDKQVTVTRTNYGASKPVHVGQYGWMALEDIGVKQSTTGSTVYVVKPGDTLSGICSRYGVNWKTIAQANNIKNPNMIVVGQKITIQK